MPVYQFQCNDCGLQFQARTNSSENTYPCECGFKAIRDLPTAPHAALGAKVTVTGPTTTGFSGIDYNADRAIGEYSKRKWGEISARCKDKLDLIEATGASGKDLSRQEDGSYRVLTQQERMMSERARDFHFNVLRNSPRFKKSSSSR